MLSRRRTRHTLGGNSDERANYSPPVSQRQYVLLPSFDELTLESGIASHLWLPAMRSC